MITFNLPAVINELRRELDMRERVYPRWVANPQNRMTQEQADTRIALLKDALTLIDMIDTGGRVVSVEYEPGSRRPDRIKVAAGDGSTHWFKRDEVTP